MDEFEIINTYFEPLARVGAASDRSHEALIGDDGAVLEFPPNERLIVTTDTLIEGRHFPPNCAADVVGFRALESNVSDLAAMGAFPRFYQLALTLSDYDDAWLSGFSSGLRMAARRHGIVLSGGDLTRGPLSVTITAMGSAPASEIMTRGGAMVGDRIMVSGSLGDAACGLQILESEQVDSLDRSAKDYLLQRFTHPSARVELGMGLRSIAHAAIDVSDGIAQDLAHIAARSNVTIELDVDRLPFSPPLIAAVSDIERRTDLALRGGDDYELAFCIAEGDRARVAKIATDCGVPITEIGRVRPRRAEVDVYCVDTTGNVVDRQTAGYRHFAQDT